MIIILLKLTEVKHRRTNEELLDQKSLHVASLFHSLHRPKATHELKSPNNIYQYR
jgi:hypothetical protein